MTNRIDLQEFEELFKWELPKEGDEWNLDSTAIGTINGQVIVRIKARPVKNSTWQKKYSAVEIHSESPGGSSSRSICHDFLCERGAKEFAVNYLFGSLRTRIVCSVCGRLAPVSGFFKEIQTKLRANKMCHSCDFWSGYVATKNNPLIARIDGKHYTIKENESGPEYCKGFSGRRFNIKWHDGRTRTTTNLWYQGHIPKHFKDELPDNAVFCTKEELP